MSKKDKKAADLPLSVALSGDVKGGKDKPTVDSRKYLSDIAKSGSDTLKAIGQNMR